MENRMILSEEMTDFFGPLYVLVTNDAITDVDYNGSDVWTTDSNNCRRRAEVSIDVDFVEQFTQRVANGVSKPFNKQNPILEAETDCLRITIVHESVALTGRLICIRKSLPYVRLTRERMIKENYCCEEVLELLISCVTNRMNMVIVGEPGSGKTELCKFLSGYIPQEDRVITIEDTPEWHYRSLHPEHDAVELQVGKTMDYTGAIKTCLRLNPKWIMLSEARSKEVVYLLESFSTGVRGMTTLHASDVRKIPDRMLNMAGGDRDMKRMENDIYSFIDVGVLVRRSQYKDAFGKIFVRRFVDQVCFFQREDGNNMCEMVVDAGKFLAPLPEERRGTYFEAKVTLG